jgi:hypothetical protein
MTVLMSVFTGIFLVDHLSVNKFILPREWKYEKEIH